ncbi:unnamed protein product [Coccothraustes coccothraustes]
MIPRPGQGEAVATFNPAAGRRAQGAADCALAQTSICVPIPYRPTHYLHGTWRFQLSLRSLPTTHQASPMLKLTESGEAASESRRSVQGSGERTSGEAGKRRSELRWGCRRAPDGDTLPGSRRGWASSPPSFLRLLGNETRAGWDCRKNISEKMS